jgi:hypothetical protein
MSAKAGPEIRDRIKELRRVKASKLLPHPRNWRTHPKGQSEALAAVLREVGYVDVLLARETPDGLVLIDGHLRRDLTPDQEVPVLILDVTEDEAAKILLTLDPLSAMATTDAQALNNLLDGIASNEDALSALLSDLADSSGAAMFGDESEPQRARVPKRKDVIVRPVFNVEQVETLERALQATGETNRADALIEICRSYLGEEGQLDLSSKSNIAA